MMSPMSDLLFRVSGVHRKGEARPHSLGKGDHDDQVTPRTPTLPLTLAPSLTLTLSLSLSLSEAYVSFATASPIRLSPSRIISFDAAYEIRANPGAPKAVPGTTAQRASSKR